MGLLSTPLHMSRFAHILALAVATLAILGCDRGCLARVTGRGEPPPDPGGVTALDGTDCSDGLARCVEGRLELARAAHLPYPCGKPGEATRVCACPWETVDRCRNGCALDGTTVFAEGDAGVVLTQLCRPDEVVARPVNAADPPAAGVCNTEGWACVNGVVRACAGAGMPIQPLAVCIHGCEAATGLPEGESPPLVEGKSVDGATAILCRRTHAERR